MKSKYSSSIFTRPKWVKHEHEFEFSILIDKADSSNFTEWSSVGQQILRTNDRIQVNDRRLHISDITTNSVLNNTTYQD